VFLLQKTLLQLTSLGFERKARLFCDDIFLMSCFDPNLIGWDLSVRLGYFVTFFSPSRGTPSLCNGEVGI